MQGRKVLDSWKDIAAYFNRSVMTCHRWEDELGLPVHRLDGTPRARVFAFTDELDQWMARKLHLIEEAPPQERRKKPFWTWLAAGGGFAAAALAIYGFMTVFRPPSPVPARVPMLAVLPFANETGAAAWDAWKTAIADLLTIDLRQSRLMDAVKTSDLYWAAGPSVEADKFSPEDLKKIAEKAEVGYTLTGSFVKSGDTIAINALVRNAETGDVVASPRAEIRTDKDIFSSVDGLSKEVKIALNIKPGDVRRDIDAPVARITTRSPEAFKLYGQAYRIQGKRKFGEAIVPLLKAVEIDPQFGLAFRILFYCCRAVDRKEDQKKYGEIAVRLADRIEERERSLFLADYYGFEQVNPAKRYQVFQSVERNYPYEKMMLGFSSYYTGREEWDKARPILERLMARYPGNPSIVQALSLCYQSLGLYDLAEKLLDDLDKMEAKPGANLMPGVERRLKLALVQKKFDAAHACADRLVSTFPNLPAGTSWKGFTYFLQDDFANAEKAYQKFVEDDDLRSQRNGYHYLAAVSLARGRVEEARQRIRRAIELDKKAGMPHFENEYHYFLAYLERLSGRLPEALTEAELACQGPEGPGLRYVRKLYLRALITVEMGKFEEFEKHAEEVKAYLDPDRSVQGSPRFMRLDYNLLGHRELQKNNLETAIRYYWKALDLLSDRGARDADDDHAKYYYDLAEAYRLQAEGVPYDISMYEKVLLPTVSREFSGDLYAKSYYWMGVRWERTMTNLGTPADVQTRRETAVGFYRKFLDLWKDADPIFPEVKDAKARLARLEAK